MRELLRELRQHTHTGSLSLRQARERILEALLSAAGLFGVLALLVTLPSFIRAGVITLFPIYALGISFVWAMKFARWLPYWVRAAWMLLSIYVFGLTELLNFGYTVDGHAYFLACTLFGTLFFNRQIGRVLLAINTATLLIVGWLISSGTFVVWGFLFRNVDLSIVIGTAFTFFSIVWALQSGISVLLTQLDTALQEERLLRDQLEQRVIERTQELAQARDHALATSRELAEQREYLSALYETTLDLLNHRDLDDLLQAIVDRATSIFDAPYSELMIREGEDLVVRAYTDNQPFLKNDRVRREESLLSWRACDSGEPVVLEDYTTWAQGRAIYAALSLRAVADFPIMANNQCRGVLALGRIAEGHLFSPQDIHKGKLFSQMIALVLENANLYQTAQRQIVERTEAEQALQRLALDLQAQNADLDAFSHTVAHDLKTPLGGIVGYSQLLQISHRKMQPEVIDRDLQAIQASGNKMATIIDELLLLASVRRSANVTYEPLDMAAIIGSVHTRLSYQISIVQGLVLYPPSWPTAVGYAPWVEEVWVNYISNALKYGGQPPRVVLGADPAVNGVVRFWVQDNGMGISLEQQALLFNDFSRLQPKRVDGHGLGLSIVQRIVERLGGSVGLTSVEGAGSRFYFTLPEVMQGAESTIPLFPPLTMPDRTRARWRWPGRRR